MMLLAVTLVVGAVLVVGWRIEVTLRARTERTMALEERKFALEEARAQKPVPNVAIPAGLLMLASRETEEWAKDQLKARMRELYAECRDWNTVAQLIAQESHGTLGDGGYPS